MKHKVILVLLDGLNAETGLECMGFLQALCQEGYGRAYTLQCELPSISRPLYECVLTGVPPVHSGIFHNGIVRLSTEQSIFHYARAAGLTTAAAAYHWVSELYNRAPFDAVRDRHTIDELLTIQYGHFYYEDNYPDSHLFVDAEHLRYRYDPDFLLVHPMNIDHAGHGFGWDSANYRNTARRADMHLSSHIKQWLDLGYQVIVTSDHGMNNDHSHGGILDEECQVPLYTFGQAFSQADAQIRQTEICGTICKLLGVEHDKPFNQELLR